MSIIRVIYTTSNVLSATYKILATTIVMYYLVKETKLRITKDDQENKETKEKTQHPR